VHERYVGDDAGVPMRTNRGSPAVKVLLVVRKCFGVGFTVLTTEVVALVQLVPSPISTFTVPTPEKQRTAVHVSAHGAGPSASVVVPVHAVEVA